MALVWTLLIVDPLIVLSTIFCGTISIVVSFFDSKGRVPMKVARGWARSILAFAWVRVQVEGLEKIDPSGAYIFVVNHQSYMDTPVVLSRIPVEFRFLAKQELFKIPFMGTYLKRGGHVPVPLEDPRASVKSLTRAAEIVREHGYSLLIFPEGGRSEDGVLQPFKEGATYIAIKSGLPIVPMALIGTREVLAMHTKAIHPGRVKLRIGEPISTAGKTLRDREELTEAARQQIIALLK